MPGFARAGSLDGCRDGIFWGDWKYRPRLRQKVRRYLAANQAKIRREADLLTDREFGALEPKEKIFKVTDREVETLKHGMVGVPQFP